MLKAKNTKKAFTYILCIMLSAVHTAKNMQSNEKMQPQSLVINISWKIVFVMQCTQNNLIGCEYLNKLSFDMLSKDNNFSFLHEPFQKNKKTCLIDPITSICELKMQHNKLMYLDDPIKEFRIEHTGQVTAAGILDNYSINPDINLLEAILIAMVKEHLIEQNYLKLEKESLSSYVPNRKGMLEELIKDKLGYNGFQKPEKQSNNDLLLRYFPAWLAKNQSFVKKIYSNLCPSDRIDKNAKTVCEICNVSVTVENNLKRNNP